MAALLSCLSPLLPSKLRPDRTEEDDKAEFSEKAGLVPARAVLAGSGEARLDKVDTTERLSKLREVMSKQGLGA